MVRLQLAGRLLSAADAESHSHLAEQHREMGLYVDAVREAAVGVAARCAFC